MKRMYIDNILRKGLEAEIEVVFTGIEEVARATFQQSIKSKRDAVAGIKHDLGLIEALLKAIEKIERKREKVRNDHYGF